MLGVVVIDRGPLELAIDVALDRGHEAPHVRGQIELAAVLGRDDEPELVLLVEPWLLEGLGARPALGVVQHALGAVLLDAVALDVAQVHGGGFGTGRVQPEHMRLDDDAPGAGAEPSDRRTRRRSARAG